jgi:hypothetical protein
MRGIKVGFSDGTQHNSIEGAIPRGSAKFLIQISKVKDSAIKVT